MENKSFSKTRFKSNFFDKISHFSTLNFNLLSNNMFTISRRDKQVSGISIVKFKKKVEKIKLILTIVFPTFQKSLFDSIRARDHQSVIKG